MQWVPNMAIVGDMLAVARKQSLKLFHDCIDF
jgi:hypothetical protein